MMLPCWYCDGKGFIYEGDAANGRDYQASCKHCGGSGKLHDDADAGDELDD